MLDIRSLFGGAGARDSPRGSSSRPTTAANTDAVNFAGKSCGPEPMGAGLSPPSSKADRMADGGMDYGDEADAGRGAYDVEALAGDAGGTEPPPELLEDRLAELEAAGGCTPTQPPPEGAAEEVVE
eukprot:3973039-Prymnesium_polylepis.1